MENQMNNDQRTEFYKLVAQSLAESERKEPGFNLAGCLLVHAIEHNLPNISLRSDGAVVVKTPEA